MVDRYDFVDSDDDGGVPEAVANPHGDYVTYDDYLGLMREYEELQHEHEMLVRDIRNLV